MSKESNPPDKEILSKVLLFADFKFTLLTKSSSEV